MPRNRCRTPLLSPLHSQGGKGNGLNKKSDHLLGDRKPTIDPR